MTAFTENTKKLENQPVCLRIKLAGLWIAAMFCYMYADILAFYDPYLLGEIQKGNMGFIGPITQGLKLGVGMLMSIPALLVLTCYLLRPSICRWLNIIFGVIFTLIILITISVSTLYYYFYFGALEVLITSYIVWLSWKWPLEISARQNSI